MAVLYATIVIGGYGKYGELTKSNILLNLPKGQTSVLLSELVMGTVIVCTYPIIAFAPRMILARAFFSNRRETPTQGTADLHAGRDNPGDTNTQSISTSPLPSSHRHRSREATRTRGGGGSPTPPNDHAGDSRCPPRGSHECSPTERWLLGFLLVLCPLSLSACVPNLGVIMSLTGCVFGVLQQGVLPPLFFLALTKGVDSREKFEQARRTAKAAIVLACVMGVLGLWGTVDTILRGGTQ